MEIGTAVRVTSNAGATAFAELNTFRMSGYVVKTDEKAGICVELYLGSTWRPCFWYPESCLARIERDQVQCTSELIENGLGGRRTMGNNMITRGAVRSWVVLKAAATTDQAIYSLIMKLDWHQLLIMWTDLTDRTLNDWVDAHSENVRRPGMLIRTTTTHTIDENIPRPGLLR